MNAKPYLIVSGIIFTLIALVHIVRIVQAWSIQIESWSAPIWISWLGIVITVFLAIWAFTLAVRHAR